MCVRAQSGAISPDGRVHRLMLSTKLYFKIPYPAVHTLSLFADVTAMSRNLQHMRGGITQQFNDLYIQLY